MLSQRRRRLSVLSSTCQHVATLQLVSGAETDRFRAFSRPHPCFLRWRWDWLRLAYVYSLDISVFLWLRKQRPKICNASPMAIFEWKTWIEELIKVIAQVNVESKNEKVERAEFNVPTCGHIAVCQRCRDRQIQSLFPTSSLFSTLKVRLIDLPWKACPQK